MCFSSPKPPTPIPTPPPPSPEVIDPQAQTAATQQRRRLASAYGRSSTILAPQSAAPTPGPKTLLGS